MAMTKNQRLTEARDKPRRMPPGGTGREYRRLRRHQRQLRDGRWSESHGVYTLMLRGKTPLCHKACPIIDECQFANPCSAPCVPLQEWGTWLLRQVAALPQVRPEDSFLIRRYVRAEQAMLRADLVCDLEDPVQDRRAQWSREANALAAQLGIGPQARRQLGLDKWVSVGDWARVWADADDDGNDSDPDAPEKRNSGQPDPQAKSGGERSGEGTQ